MPRQPDMNPRILATVAFTATTLAAATALACSMPEDPIPMVPSWDPGSGRAVVDEPIPVDGVVYVPADLGDNFLPRDLVDPDGVEVEWDIERSSFSDDIDEAVPVGGWILGEYHRPGAEEGAVPTYTIVDEIDDTPPEFEIEGWTGRSEKYVIAFCGDSHVRSGVYVSIDGPGEPVVYVWETVPSGAAEPRTGAWLDWDRLVPAPTGQAFELRVTAVDLSGNSAVRSTEEAVACDGCEGSVSGGHASGLGLLVLAAAAIRRRRE